MDNYQIEVIDDKIKLLETTNFNIKKISITSKHSQEDLTMVKKQFLIKKNQAAYLILEIIVQNNGALNISDEEIWRNYAVIGFSNFVYFIDLNKDIADSFQLDCYFCRFYCFDSFALVSSGTELIKFDKNARMLWKTKNLAVDGIMVSEIKNGIIYGEAEWDPLGGWQLFEVDLETGKILVGDYYKYI